MVSGIAWSVTEWRSAGHNVAGPGVVSLARRVDSTFTDACQALGLALAAGCLFGSLGRPGVLRWALAVVAVAAGVVLALVAGPPLALGVAIGIVASLLAYSVASSVASGAARRAADAGSGSVGALLAFVALLIAVVSLLVPPVAIVALVGIAFLAVARRRRARRKYAGLRVLR